MKTVKPKFVKCPDCGGRGQKPKIITRMLDYVEVGKVTVLYQCKTCGGAGTIAEKTT